MKKKIKVSAPGKLMLFGEHAVIYGQPCIVTAVNHRMAVNIELVDSKKIVINAPDVKVSNYQRSIENQLDPADLPKGVRFVSVAVDNFIKKYQVKPGGLMINTKSEFSSEFGFGSSSAVTVATIYALAQLFGVRTSKKDIFDLSYKTVLDVQGLGSGFDLATAIYGGTLFFRAGGKEIKPLGDWRLPLVVGYTGIKADTTELVKKVADLKNKESRLLDSIFVDMGIVSERAKMAIKNKNSRFVGRLMDVNQGLLDSIGVNTKELSKLIFAAREAGAYGAKLSGAGGGDCMICFVPQSRKIAVERSIKNAGGIIIEVEPSVIGVKVER